MSELPCPDHPFGGCGCSGPWCRERFGPAPANSARTSLTATAFYSAWQSTGVGRRPVGQARQPGPRAPTGQPLTADEAIAASWKRVTTKWRAEQAAAGARPPDPRRPVRTAEVPALPATKPLELPAGSADVLDFTFLPRKEQQ